MGGLCYVYEAFFKSEIGEENDSTDDPFIDIGDGDDGRE
jgi:hypothetical protein